MATKLGTAVLEIHLTIGDLYVIDNYVVIDYVEGGITALSVQDQGTATLEIHERHIVDASKTIS